MTKSIFCAQGGVSTWQNAVSAEKVLFTVTTYLTPTVKLTDVGSPTFVPSK